MNATELLTLENLDVAAGGKGLLQGVSLSLRERGRVALTGPSGCGKTTLLRAVAGLIDPAAGAVRLRGESPATVGWPAFRRQVAYVAQQPVLFDATVAANLARPFRYRSVAGAFARERAAALLERLGLDCLEENARELSVGQQQRVCLARALLVQPAVLLLDEPAAALDEDAATKMEKLLLEQADAGLGVLLVTHNWRQAGRWCERQLDLTEHRAQP